MMSIVKFHPPAFLVILSVKKKKKKGNTISIFYNKLFLSHILLWLIIKNLLIKKNIYIYIKNLIMLSTNKNLVFDQFKRESTV